jgi:hypothetical protein
LNHNDSKDRNVNANNTDPLFPSLDPASEISITTFIERVSTAKARNRLISWGMGCSIGAQGNECLFVAYTVTQYTIKGLGGSFAEAYPQFLKEWDKVM